MSLKDNYKQMLDAVASQLNSQWTATVGLVQAGGSGGSAELTDEEFLELLEITDLADTVNIAVDGVEYKLSDTDGSVLYFY